MGKSAIFIMFHITINHCYGCLDIGVSYQLICILSYHRYFVDSSEVNDSVPFIFTVGAKDQAIVGVDEGIRGMKAGGIRR